MLDRKKIESLIQKYGIDKLKGVLIQMFGWLKKAKETINPPDMFDRIKAYLTENAPDILENYELHYYPSEFLNSRVEFENKFYRKEKHWDTDNTFGFRLRDLCGGCVNEYDTMNGMGSFSSVIESLTIFKTDIKNDWSVLDEKIEVMRKIDKEFKECFAEARKYFDLLNDNGLNGFDFSINCYLGKVHSITVIPGNFKKFFEYVKSQLNTEKEIQAYEEYCYKQFKLNLGKGYLNAYGPSVAMDLPFAWREELTESEKIANDPDYVSANSACKDVLDRIMKTTIDTKDE